MYNNVLKQSRVLPYPNMIQNAITFEVFLTQYEYFRFEYGIVDLLSELGGLFSVFKIAAFSLIYVFISDPKLFILSDLVKPMISIKSKPGEIVSLPSHQEV